MTAQLLDTVMSPEAGIQKSVGGPPPGRGGLFGRPPGGPPPGMGGQAPSSPAFTRRLDTLENKALYLVDIGFGGGYNFMVQLQKWFTENMPSVKTIVRRKPGNVFMDDSPELWEEVKEKGHAVVLGVAG
jgi:hypothetical protein